MTTAKTTVLGSAVFHSSGSPNSSRKLSRPIQTVSPVTSCAQAEVLAATATTTRNSGKSSSPPSTIRAGASSSQGRQVCTVP